MSDTYHKVGTSYRTAFPYVLPSGAVTGLSSGSFTIELSKNGTGNQSTTGITLSQVDATNNAGEYDIVVSGSTGFTAAVGVYEMVVYRTATPIDRWSETVRVTVDGSGIGSFGTVSFTATASNGRVMSGGSPLTGATVRILTPTGGLYAQLTSNASGLWGPVWFVDDGTYAVYVQRGGYTTASGTIVISGTATIATGPGADLSITASSSSSGLTASSLWAYFKRALRDRSGSQADLLAQQGVDDALWMISQEREWPWYHTTQAITVQPYYQTGTIALTNASTTCTLTGGTWPTWAASGDIYVGGQWYPVATRTSGTVVVLDQAWGDDNETAATYTIAQTRYDLPDDLQSLDRVLFDQTWASYAPQAVSLPMVMRARSQAQFGQARASLWAIKKDQIVLWPLPTERVTFEMLYYRRPPALATDSDEADWDPLHLSLLRRAIEYQASLRGDCIVGDSAKCMQLYLATLEKAGNFDKTATDREISDLDVSIDNSWWRGTTVS